MKQSEKLQSAHYDRIAQQYEVHYDDYWSQIYRKWFVYRGLFREVELGDKVVLEAMCGSGQATAFLLSRGAQVVGLDISGDLVKSFRNKYPTSQVINRSVLNTGLASATLDGVVVIGGLHHVHPHVGQALAEIHRVLKPGGFLCFFEPHAASYFDRLRQWWYRRDRKFFETNEAALDIPALKAQYRDLFAVEYERYGGSVAYLLVYNSLVFRLPLWSKKLYSWFLFLVEWVLTPFLGERTSFYITSRWRKL